MLFAPYDILSLSPLFLLLFIPPLYYLSLSLFLLLFIPLYIIPLSSCSYCFYYYSPFFIYYPSLSLSSILFPPYLPLSVASETISGIDIGILNQNTPIFRKIVVFGTNTDRDLNS